MSLKMIQCHRCGTMFENFYSDSLKLCKPCRTLIRIQNENPIPTKSEEEVLAEGVVLSELFNSQQSNGTTDAPDFGGHGGEFAGGGASGGYESPDFSNVDSGSSFSDAGGGGDGS